jgi:ABC-type multidrug transport system ATPase subunit
MIKIFEVYKNYVGKTILNGISFEVKPGEFVTLIGRIGSGKSTIINIICGLVKPDSGQFLYNGTLVDFSNRAYMKNIGFLLSGDYLIEDFSTILYWECIGRLLNFRRDYIKKRIKYLLDLCEISDPHKPINQLSSGNKMLVKIGTMLFNAPQILIIDEPFINLDIGEIFKIEKILLECHKTGNTVFMTTHYPEPIFRISNELLLLENGVIKDHLFVKEYANYDSFRNNLSDYFRKGQD